MSHSMVNRSAAVAHLAAENRNYTDAFVELDRAAWPPSWLDLDTPALQVWRSARFLVVLFDDDNGPRLTVNRTRLDPLSTRWADGITWDELMAIKAGVGLGDRWAIEIYPPDDAVVDVQNMRHLWLLDDKPPTAW